VVRKSKVGSSGKVPVDGPRGEFPEARCLFHNKNRICDVKMQINGTFCLKFTTAHNTVSYAQSDRPIAQSCVLAATLRIFELHSLHIFYF